MVHTPGHTPDALSWIDFDESTIYVGDSFYRMSQEMEPIIIPPQGDLIEWFNSLHKLEAFISYHRGANSTASQPAQDTPNMHGFKLSAAHTTCNVSAHDSLRQALLFWRQLIRPVRKPLLSQERFGETFDYYLLKDPNQDLFSNMAMLLPRRLVDSANSFYGQVQG